MSTASRLISGTLASWARIIVTLLMQISLVPIFLTYWDVSTYGIWLGIQALVNILGILDRAYVDYLGYEFLKLGKENTVRISKNLWSGIKIIYILGSIEIILIALFSFSDFLPGVLIEKNNAEQSLLWQASWTLVLQWAGWAIFTNTTGLFFRALSVWGHFARMAWWDVIISFLSALLSVIIVIYGGNLIMVGIGSFIFLGIITIPKCYDIYRLLKKEKIVKVSGSYKLGFDNYIVSLVLSGRYFFENFRQQGIRLILTQMVGIKGLVAFSTMRTGANVIQQGLLTITNPMLPELMRFLNQKQQEKMEATFGTVWFVLIGLLCPGVIILQTIISPIYTVWTQGKIAFDPFLFGTLSISILVYAVAQPAMAIIIGNNQLKKQILLSVIAAITLVLGLFIFIPLFGLSGAGLALLIAEVITAFGFIKYAIKWLESNNLNWPVKTANSAICAVFITTIGVVFINIFPDMIWAIFAVYSFLFLVIIVYYWSHTPDLTKFKLNELFNKVFSTSI